MTWERLTRRLELPSWLKRGLSVVMRLFAVVLGLVAVVLGLFAAWASVEWFLEARRGAFAPWRAVSSLVLALGALAYGSRRLWPAKTGPRVNRMRVAKFAALGGFAGVVVTSCPSRPDLPSLAGGHQPHPQPARTGHPNAPEDRHECTGPVVEGN